MSPSEHEVMAVVSVLEDVDVVDACNVCVQGFRRL